MKITLVAFGVARDILRAKKTALELPSGSSIAGLKSCLLAEHPDFSKLNSLSFAVGENYQEDDYALRDGDEVVVIPPVSGG
jgi:molybdopterin converting factor small subunit